MSDFVHLHVHTQYSLLDGMNTTIKLFEKVKESGMKSVAITDHGVLYGVPEFWKFSKDFGIKPIIGCEMYLSPSSMTIKQEIEGIRYYHLLLLAKNLAGYKNLAKLVTKSHLDGMYYKPRVDIETLSKHSEGLICTSACLAGPISRHIVRDELPKAEEWLKKLHSIFKEDFYLEIQRNGLICEDKIKDDLINKLPLDEQEEQLDLLKQQIKVNKQLYKFSDQYKIPIITTTDAHYLNEQDKEVQKILFCIKDGTNVNDPNTRKGYIETYIKTPEELKTIFSDMPEALENTLKIDEKIENYSIKFERVQPKYWNLPKGTTAKDELRRQTYEGSKDKYGKMTKELQERIDYELMVIDKMGYNDYFLVVGDLMQFARKSGIVIGVRGSAAGSVVAYCLGITNVEPIKWELYFERFLNLERASPPDIDMDIQDDRRDEIIKYAKEKYGEKNVGAIITFGKMATKAAIRDVARVMGIDLSTADKLSKKVTVLFGKPFKFDQMMETDPEFKQMVDSDPQLQKLGEAVKKIEGLNRHSGVHAAGYLITPEPMDEYMAFQRDTKEPESYVTQMDGNWIDKLDFMKFDFLGLRTLTIIKNALEYIKKINGVDIDLQKLAQDDQKTFELFSRGETVGVFQFESPPMQQYLKELQPHDIEDICFLAAAYRPGPMKFIPDYIKCKHSEKDAEYLIPELEPVLQKTFGFPIYQEQLLAICMQFGGFSLGEGDVIRNALKKKQLDILQTKEPDFVKYFKENYPQHGESKAKELWSQLKPFSDYGFNKAHSASYAVVAYWCAYLKAHYPLEFITALMHSDLENLDRVVVDIKEARRMGYQILPPSVNKSDVYFTPENETGIRFGLGAIKNVGAKACEQIIAERKKNGEFRNFDELVNRVGTKNLNKKSLECLIMAGAMDEFGDRNALLKIIPEVVEKASKQEKAEALGQSGLFSIMEEHDGIKRIDATLFPAYEPCTEKQRMEWEKELMGLYISIHPLEKYIWTGVIPGTVYTDQVEHLSHQSQIKIVGMLGNIKLTLTKKDQSKMAIARVEDMHGNCDAVIFPKAYEKLSKMNLIEDGRPFLISGTINERDDRKSLIIDNIEPANILIKPKKIKIDIRGIDSMDQLNRIKDCFAKGGEVEVEVIYGGNGTRKSIIKNVNIDLEENVLILQKYIVP